MDEYPSIPCRSQFLWPSYPTSRGLRPYCFGFGGQWWPVTRVTCHKSHRFRMIRPIQRPAVELCDSPDCNINNCHHPTSTQRSQRSQRFRDFRFCGMKQSNAKSNAIFVNLWTEGWEWSEHLTPGMDLGKRSIGFADKSVSNRSRNVSEFGQHKIQWKYSEHSLT